jgi:hypothetical protein
MIESVGRRGKVAVVVIAALLVSVAGSPQRTQAAAADPAVVAQWNATAVATIVGDAGLANPSAFLYYAFTHAAIYNAVNGITREYELYRWGNLGPRSASPQAAAAAAGHRLLLHYFPASQARLDADLATSLGAIPDGRAETRGIAYGERAADRIIRLRENDGRNAPVPYERAPAPGIWRPTPPGFVPFFGTWLGQVRPLLIESSTQFEPGPPPALTSARYTREFNEVKAVGSKTSTVRTADQTQTALFFSDTGIGPLQGALRDLVTRHGLDISDSARLFAAVDMSIADTAITTWACKLNFAYWRPITAIQLADEDGNPDTIPDPAWEPLVVNPPYAEYSSGLTSVVGATSRALTRVLGTGRIDLMLTSTAAGVTRHYEHARELNSDAVEARIWSGIHFRTADVVGNKLGKNVADWVLDRYFAPVD